MTTDPAVRSTAPEIVGNGDPLAHWLAMGFSPISASSSMLTGWRSSWGTCAIPRGWEICHRCDNPSIGAWS